MSRLGLSLVLLSFLGCGDENSAGMDMSVEDMAADMTMMSQPDLTVPADLAYFHEVDAGGVNCGPGPKCTGGQICCVSGLGGGSPSAMCVAPAACNGDAGVTIACNGPGNCGGNPCCLQLQGMSVASISCTTTPSACPVMFSLSGGDSQTRACHYDGDCTAGLTGTQMYPDCCHVVADPTQRFCFSKTFVGATQGQLACP